MTVKIEECRCRRPAARWTFSPRPSGGSSSMLATPLVREPIGESAAAGLAQVFKALATRSGSGWCP